MVDSAVSLNKLYSEVVTDGDIGDLDLIKLYAEAIVGDAGQEDNRTVDLAKLYAEVVTDEIPIRTLVQLDLNSQPTAERSTSPNFVLFQPLTENKFFNYVCPDSDVGPHTIIGIRPDCTSFVINPTLTAGLNKIILDHFTQLYVYPGTITSSEIQDALIRGMVDRNGQCVAQAPDPVGTFEDPANANYYHNILDDGLTDSSAVSILLNEA